MAKETATACTQEGERMTVPRFALSVRQPWAWAIVHGHKPVENRDWRKPNPGLSFRGEFAVHASKGMTRREYEEAAGFMECLGISCPEARDLPRGGIVGQATLGDIVKDFDNPWFFGRLGLMLSDAKACPFIGCDGMLGFFEWRSRVSGNPADTPARWMLERSVESAPGPATSPLQADLLARLT